jgi:hypothetical protein
MQNTQAYKQTTKRQDVNASIFHNATGSELSATVATDIRTTLHSAITFTSLNDELLFNYTATTLLNADIARSYTRAAQNTLSTNNSKHLTSRRSF